MFYSKITLNLKTLQFLVNPIDGDREVKENTYLFFYPEVSTYHDSNAIPAGKRALMRHVITKLNKEIKDSEKELETSKNLRKIILNKLSI